MGSIFLAFYACRCDELNISSVVCFRFHQDISPILKNSVFLSEINEFEVRVCIGPFMSANSFLPLTQFLKHLQSGAKSSSDGCIFRFPSKNPFEIACHLDLDLQLRWKTALKSLPYWGYNGGATLAEARRGLRPRLARRWDAK